MHKVRPAALAAFAVLASIPFAGFAQEKPSQAVKAEKEVDPLIQAYAVGNYSRVRTLGADRKNEPLASLLLSMTKAYDKTQSEATAKEGVRELGLFYANKANPKALRILAGLSYARCAQLMQDRKDIYGDFADKIEYRKIYKDIMESVPNSKEAATAFLYMYPDKETVDEYIRNFKGDTQLLIPLHLYTANRLIKEKKDYKNAVEHLKAAYALNIVHPSIRRSLLLRIGYLYEKRLNDFKSAEPYYREYIKRYPLSTQAVVIQRFMKARGVK